MVIWFANRIRLRMRHGTSDRKMTRTTNTNELPAWLSHCRPSFCPTANCIKRFETSEKCSFTSGAPRAYLQSNGTMLTAHVGSLTPCELLSHQADAIKHLPRAIPPGFTKCLRTHLPLWRYRFIACDRRSKN